MFGLPSFFPPAKETLGCEDSLTDPSTQSLGTLLEEQRQLFSQPQ